MNSFFNNLKYLYSFLHYLYKNFSIFRYLIFGAFFLIFVEYVALSISLLLIENNNFVKESSFSFSLWNTFFNFFNLNLNKSQIFWLFIILLTFRILLGFAFSNLSFYFSKKIHLLFNNKIFNEIINNISLLKIYKRSVGYYLQLAGDSSFKSGAIIVSILELIVAMTSGLVSLYILYQFSKFFFLLSIVFILLCLLTYFFLFKFFFKINYSSVNYSKLASTLFLDGINNLRSIRTIKGENFIVAAHNNLMKDYTKSLFYLDFLKKAFKTVPVFILLSFAIYYFYPKYAVKNDSIDISFFFTLIIILSRVLSSLGVILSSFIDFLIQFKFVKDINDLTNIFNKENNTFAKYNKKNNSIIFSITLKNLFFNFNNNTKILDNFNYRFLKNNIYAITGKSGTGKSTLVDIISGLTSGFKGNLFFNDNINNNNLFHNIILVEQDSKIFTGTVYENMTLGNYFKIDEIKKVLIYLNLNKFAQNLNLKLNYRGSNISGGEKQRFAIARALLRNPEVLILDEATNALDENTFKIVMKKLKLFMKKKILIFITHEERVNKYVNKKIEFK